MKSAFVCALITLSVAAAIRIPSALCDPRFTKIVDTYTTVPNTAATFNPNITDMPAINAGQVAFADGDGTIWSTTPTGGKLRRLVTTNTRIPGGGGTTFQQYYGDSIQIFDGTVAFLGSNCAGCGYFGLYTVPAARGRVQKLADNGDFPGGQFPGFFHVNTDGNGVDQVVFDNTLGPGGQTGDNVFLVPLAGGPFAHVIGGGSDNKYGDYCCNAGEADISQGTIAFRYSSVYGLGGIFTIDTSGDPDSEAQATDQGAFDPFSISLPQVDNGTVAFFAQSPDDSVAGIYSAPAGGGPATTLADTNTPVPGGTGTFQWPNGFNTIAARDGLVVFNGIDAAGNLGLYAVPETGGKIRKVVAGGDPIGNGFSVQKPLMGAEAVSQGVVVFFVFYNGSLGQGLYAAHLR